jgi:hypothetical protein
MSEKEKKTGDLEQSSDEERRDFLAKAVAAAGALAATGMLTGALSSEADAQITRRATVQAPTVRRTETIRGSALKYAKLSQGHELSIGGRELNDVLIREGLLSKDMLGKESVMSLKLEWT